MSPRRFDEPDISLDPPRAEQCVRTACEEHPELTNTLGHGRQGQRERSLTVAEIKTQLREAFADWSIITSDQGRWWATRGPLPDDRMHEVATFDADSPEQLAARLRQVQAGLSFFGPLDDLYHAVRHYAPEVTVACVRSPEAAGLGAPGLSMRVTHGQVGPYLIVWDDDGSTYRWASGPHVGNEVGRSGNLEQAADAVVKALGVVERCARMPECLDHPKLADVLGHDQQGHAILHAVAHTGITSCEQLAEQSYQDLIDVPNLGPTRIARLRARLAEAGLGSR